jgi:hypothetical protein
MNARYVVLVPPGEQGAAWRAALADAAGREGLAYVEDGFPPNSTEGFLLVYDEPGLVDLVPADRVVIVGRGDDIISALAGGTTGFPASAIRQAARWFWHANALVRYGSAVLIEAGATELMLTGLGIVSIASVNRVANPPGATHPLAVYDNLPPKQGVEFPIPHQLFHYGVREDSLLGPIDLTGRARLLVHGPHLMVPEGQWRIRARFNLILGGPPVTLAFSWGCDESMPVFKRRMDQSGAFEIEMVTQAPFSADVQFRIALAVPVLQGELVFLSATIELL